MRRTIPFLLLGLLTVIAAFGLGLGIGTASSVTMGCQTVPGGAPGLTAHCVPDKLVAATDVSSPTAYATTSLHLAIADIDPTGAQALTLVPLQVTHYQVFHGGNMPEQVLAVMSFKSADLPGALHSGRLPGDHVHQVTLNGTVRSVAVGTNGIVAVAWPSSGRTNVVVGQGLTSAQVESFVSSLT